MTTSTESHLSDQSAHGKMYPHKAICVWCNVPYNKDLSDAKDFNNYCSAECARIDDLIVSAYNKE